MLLGRKEITGESSSKSWKRSYSHLIWATHTTQALIETIQKKVARKELTDAEALKRGLRDEIRGYLDRPGSATGPPGPWRALRHHGGGGKRGGKDHVHRKGRPHDEETGKTGACWWPRTPSGLRRRSNWRCGVSGSGWKSSSSILGATPQRWSSMGLQRGSPERRMSS